MPKPLSQILSSVKKGTDLVLNSDYDVVWTGVYPAGLNQYNEYMESIAIPGKTIQTNDVKTANSIVQKIANDITFEDMEVVWRLPKTMMVYKIIDFWMSKVKQIDTNTGFVTTGYFDDYCLANSCEISVTTGSNNQGGFENTKIVRIRGLYPTSVQSIQFSGEGGEYLKLNTTFACYTVQVL